jgi:hypothetical protein
MSEQSEFDTSLDRRLIPMRIIAFAMPMGAVVALGIFLFLRMQGQLPPPPDLPLITIAVFGTAFVSLLMYLLIARQIAASSRQRLAREDAGGSPGEWLGVYQARLIALLAILEGNTFSLLIAYLLEGLPISLAGAGVLLLGMLMLFPTRSGVQNWIANQRELTQQEGQASM